MINWIPKITYPASTEATTITFALPVEGDPENEELAAKNHTVISISGVVQNTQDRIDETITVKFVWVTSTLMAAVRTWFETSASKKTTFYFYPHASEATKVEYYLADDKLNIDRSIPDGSNDFDYDFTLKMRRTI